MTVKKRILANAATVTAVGWVKEDRRRPTMIVEKRILANAATETAVGWVKEERRRPTVDV